MATNNEAYPAEVFWSDEDEGFIAIAPDLHGCSAWGETQADALRELQDAIEAWKLAAKAAGNPIPHPSTKAPTAEFSGKFVVRLAKSLHARLAHEAKGEGISLNSWVVHLLSAKPAPVVQTAPALAYNTSAIIGTAMVTTSLSIGPTGVDKLSQEQWRQLFADPSYRGSADGPKVLIPFALQEHRSRTHG